MTQHPLAINRRLRRILTRVRLAAAAAATTAAALAQAPADSADSTGHDQVIHMSQFEVTTTQGHGYVSTNAASGFKTDEPLMDIPQVDVVVTRDLLDNLNYESTVDILKYFGMPGTQNGEGLRERGFAAAYPYTDDMPSTQNYSDSVWVDSIEIIKGPAETLYINAPLAGVIIKNSKRPLPYAQDVLTASVDNWGHYRFTADFTGPVGQVGDSKIGFRLIGAWQAGKMYFDNYKDDREVVMPEFSVQYHNTYIRAFYNYQKITNTHGYDLITPTGLLYTGAGRQQADTPPGDFVHINQYQLELEVSQKISDTWENRVLAQEWYSRIYEAQIINLKGYDWGTQTQYLSNRLVNELYRYWTILDDTTGRYELGPASWSMKNIDTFGYSFSSQTNQLQNWVNAPFGDTAMGIPLLSGQPAGTLAVPLNNSAAINALHVPTPSQYTAPALLGNTGYTDFDAIYWQHSIEVVPNWFEIIGGFTWDFVTTASVANISTLPFTAQYVTTPQWIHRVGGLLHLWRNVTLYAVNSTVFSPPASGAVLETGQLPPNIVGKGTELGIKSLFLGGRLSAEAAWFLFPSLNATAVAGTLPNGLTYSAPIGPTVEEGVDGDLAFTVLPGWQVIGTWYAGHDRDQNNNPVTESYDNSWTFFNRYDFPKGSALQGLSIGGGISRIGGRWLATAGEILDAPGLLPKNNDIKLQTGNDVDAFVTYKWGRHWLLKLNCQNILNEAWPATDQSVVLVDPSNPRTFIFEADYRF